MDRQVYGVGWIGFSVLMFLLSLSVQADESAMPEVQPPIGVFGSTIHAQGDVMLSYRFNRDDYKGLLVGRNSVSDAFVASEYAVVPTALRVTEHVFEAMWAPVEEFTVVVSLPFYEKSLDWYASTNPSGASTTTVKGFGDISLNFLYRVFEDKNGRLHLNLGLGFPSGSIQESAPTPISNGQLERLPYVMQLGSGTIDLKPGVTYNGYWKGFQWGAQLLGTLHAGTNSQQYTMGNEYSMTGWLGRKWTRWFGTGFRLVWQQVFNPEGEDVRLLPPESPLSDSRLQASRRLDALFGIDFYLTGGRLKGLRLSVEAGLPAFQSLDGPQLRNRWGVTAGLQYAF
ncbi:MAG: hypothetical protein CL917_06035 [Deltaproteobacteria bacterium]|nr:hypothetical protein [Deltaproteobacteria bacterium]